MTTEEYILTLNGQVSHLKDGSIVAIAAQDTHSMMLERIFENGKMADGSEIGVYDYSHPLYVNPSTSPKSFPAIGKNGNAKFENGNNHKTGYFESYQAYRNKIGRKTDKADLTLSGIFKSDFSRAVVRVSELVYTAGVSQVRSQKIIEGVQEKYGDVFSLSEKEKENFLETIKYESLQILSA